MMPMGTAARRGSVSPMKKVDPMAHRNRTTTMFIIASVYTVLVTIMAASCLGPKFAVTAVLGVILGGGLAWVRTHLTR